LNQGEEIRLSLALICSAFLLGVVLLPMKRIDPFIVVGTWIFSIAVAIYPVIWLILDGEPFIWLLNFVLSKKVHALVSHFEIRLCTYRYFSSGFLCLEHGCHIDHNN
jgi:hypothetical protein